MQQAALSRRERQLGQMKQTTITAVLTEIKEIKEIRLSYSLEFIAHVILEKQSANVPKGTKKKLQESYLSHVFCLRNLR